MGNTPGSKSIDAEIFPSLSTRTKLECVADWSTKQARPKQSAGNMFVSRRTRLIADRGLSVCPMLSYHPAKF